MAVRFSDEQVMQATGATRLRLGARASYTSVSTDSRTVLPGSLFVALKGEKFDGHAFLAQAIAAGAEAVVVQRGAAGALPSDAIGIYEVPDTLAALGGLARAHRSRFKLPLGAVTGSNGKTTTKELIGAILETRGPALKTQGNLNNEVGVPLTLFNLAPKHVAAIVEMGMNHEGEIGRLTAIARPDAGLITVVQPAHLEGLGSIEGVARAKGELFRGLGPGTTAVVNLDDPRVEAQAKGLAARLFTFGRAAGAQVRLAEVAPKGREGQVLTVEHEGAAHTVQLALVGEHNALNATGAFAMGLALGYSPAECVAGLAAAKAHQRRLQLLEAPHGVTVIDDCYNANPASMLAALGTLRQLAGSGRAVAVLGDMLELGEGEAAEHTALGVAAARHAQLLACFGPRMKAAYEQAARTLGGAARHFDEVGPLLDWLRAELRPQDTVLVKGSRGMRLERVVEGLTGAPAEGKH